MEREIGEIFEYNGEWYQCVPSIGCSECNLSIVCDTSKNTRGNCLSNERSDGENVVFERIEKEGEPFSKLLPTGNVKSFQRYSTYENPIFNETDVTVLIPKGQFHYIDIEIKQNKEDMEDNNNKVSKNKELNDLVYEYIEELIDYNEFEKGIKEWYVKYSDSEKIGKNLKPFDLNLARQGKPVCTRNGAKARIICFDANNNKKIVALVDLNNDGHEDIICYYNNGRIKYSEITNNDLMLVTEKKEGWANIIEPFGNDKIVLGSIFDSYEDAVKSGKDNDRYITTVKLSWEE